MLMKSGMDLLHALTLPSPFRSYTYTTTQGTLPIPTETPLSHSRGESWRAMQANQFDW